MKNFSKFVLGAFAALVLGIAGLALADNTGSSITFGWNPVSGLEVSHGADVSGGVSPAITVSGSGCAISAVKGGAYAGSFSSGAGTSCTFTITFPSAAPNGWVCTITDLTTPADGPAKQASTTTTTCVTGATTVVSGDVMQFSAVGY